jgi:hypothetical protein
VKCEKGRCENFAFFPMYGMHKIYSHEVAEYVSDGRSPSGASAANDEP